MVSKLQQYLDAVQERANAATAGPWESGSTVTNWPEDTECPDVLMEWMDNGGEYASNWDQVKVDAAFIAAARTDVPRLLRLARSLVAILDSRSLDEVKVRVAAADAVIAEIEAEV
jgi:hypothetical protein